MTLLRALLAVSLSLAAPFAAAQWSPTKPMRIVVPFPAGGIVDL
ncbi:MAG: tripartite tricarboxylate transporter substrate binding protein, partial [Betaproteobacteria bacterium]|nr:tripartite tricarboxylate transporter substrate binding protein [Betaproteobacteria bacterium]